LSAVRLEVFPDDKLAGKGPGRSVNGNFVLTDVRVALDGKPVNLGSYIGKKPVLLEFWATWCTLCEEMLPRIKAAHAAYGDRVEFVGINVTVNQTPARVRRYLESHQPPYRTLYDDQGTSIRAYQVPATSYIVVVDRAGKVAYTGSGGEQNLEPVLKQVTSR